MRNADRYASQSLVPSLDLHYYHFAKSAEKKNVAEFRAEFKCDKLIATKRSKSKKKKKR
jgi:hypothetical protein